MTGKEKCKLLKQIRKEIAESNGIVYLTSECTFEGECRGTCPKCDAEIRYLDNELQSKADRGEKITLAGLSLNTLEQVTDEANVTDEQSSDTIDNIPKMGLILEHEPLVEGEVETYTLHLLDMSIEELDISQRTTTCLKRSGINTVGAICDRTLEDMMKIRLLGTKSLREIQSKLTLLGLGFKKS